MDVDIDFKAPCPPETLFAWVDDLGRYPRWLDLVARAEPVPAHEGDEGPAWAVDLRARMGPLARSKRLRMVRTRHQAPEVARFERREHDGRDHSAWVLQASVAAKGSRSSRLTMHLHYGGALFGPLLERKLHDEVARCRPRLLALVSG
ncbi:MAG TPA: SRPBCC family protein [Acidimicrobiales bacterium]|nr:SRPBCC family protein [Acidimicrobiales bacterium]